MLTAQSHHVTTFTTKGEVGCRGGTQMSAGCRLFESLHLQVRGLPVQEGGWFSSTTSLSPSRSPVVLPGMPGEGHRLTHFRLQWLRGKTGCRRRSWRRRGTGAGDTIRMPGGEHGVPEDKGSWYSHTTVTYSGWSRGRACGPPGPAVVGWTGGLGQVV